MNKEIKIWALYKIIAEPAPEGENTKKDLVFTDGVKELCTILTEVKKASHTLFEITEQYTALGTPEEIKEAIEKAKKYDELQKQFEEAKKRLAEYKEPDYGPIETFDDAPEEGKTGKI